MNGFLHQRGQSALPFILLIGGIIIEIAIAGALIAFFINSAALGERLSARAFSAANTGIYDSAAKISSNKSLSSETYNIPLGEDSASVEIVRSDENGFFVFTTNSTGSAGDRQRKLRAEFVVDKKTGRMSLRSVEEVLVQN